VVAGLVTGIRAPRVLSPQNRLSDSQNWRTVELVLEGVVFLTMGLQISSIVASVENDHAGVGPAVLIAIGALVLTILVRAAYVAPLLGILARRGKRMGPLRERLEGMEQKLGTPDGTQEAWDEVNQRRQTRGVRPGGEPGGRATSRPPSERRLNMFARRVTQGLADIRYFARQPLGWREGTAVVWAGMRGAVTVAAAQTLPEDTPQRSVLVLIAFVVAALSLLVQGGTIGPLVRRLAPKTDAAAEPSAEEGPTSEEDAERSQIFELLRDSLASVPEPAELTSGERSAAQFGVMRAYRLEVIEAQRSALLDARDNGTFDADVLAEELANLDASQIALEMRSRLN